MGNHQFALRSSLLVFVALGFFLAWLRSLGSMSYALIVVSHSPLAWLSCLAASFSIARRNGSVIHGRKSRVVLMILFVGIFINVFYLAWGHYRAMNVNVFGLDRGFPHPDFAVNSLERWLNFRRPVPMRTVKLHGVYPLVGLILGVLLLISMSASGLLLGTLLNRPKDSNGGG